MRQKDLAVIILAAGRGNRMRAVRPKVLHTLAGRSLLGHVVACAASLSPRHVLVIAPPGHEGFSQAAPGARLIVQDPPRGTGDAVLCARDALKNFKGNILILCGDTPLIRKATLGRLLRRLDHADKNQQRVDLAVLGVHVDASSSYGRLIADSRGALTAIVEAGDATPAQRRLTLCSSGVFAARPSALFPVLQSLDNNNVQGEFYLPDVVGLIVGRGGRAVTVTGHDRAELMGINTQKELAQAEVVMQNRLRTRAMDRGVSLIGPETVWLTCDTKLAPGVTVGPHVVFGNGVTVDKGATIEAFCHISGTRVAAGARVGPFARLRPGTFVGKDAKVGNFVEVKNAVLETNVKAGHLSYIGDARVGDGANIGAGVITCNYDGVNKHHTDIGSGSFIGSNTALVAPVAVGVGATIGAGSVIGHDVAADSLALTRAPLTDKPGWKKSKVPSSHRKTVGKTTKALGTAKRNGKETG